MTGGTGRVVTQEDLDKITERLHNAHTKASSGGARCRAPSARARDQVAPQPLPEDARQEIYRRLYRAQTKASSGGARCKSADPPAPRGLGLKMLPVIEGLDGRFSGTRGMKREEVEGGVAQRLYRAQTASGRARKDFPRILLWPERTLVGGDTGRVLAYHQTGAVSKQAVLGTREKWFI